MDFVFLVAIFIILGSFMWKFLFKRVWYELSIRAFDKTAKRIAKINKKILKTN